MSVLTHNLLAAPFQEVVGNNGCTYEERVIAIDRGRQLGLAANVLTSLADELTALHTDGMCPPTHIGTSPTKEWSDWADATRA